MKIVAIVQARMGSSRLAGKVMRDLAGEPMLVRVVERLRGSRLINQIVIATTTKPADEAIEKLCAERKWDCYRGDEQDVLDRYYQAARQVSADVVVRITSDCPMIDPAVTDAVITAFLDGQPKVDYAVNVGYPRGLDTEVMRFDSLARAWRQATQPAEREHVTPYLYWHPELFGLLELANTEDLSNWRWTVDTPEDFQLVELIFRHFGTAPFVWRDVLELCEQHPSWMEINRSIQQKIL